MTNPKSDVLHPNPKPGLGTPTKEIPEREYPYPDKFDLTPDYIHYSSLDAWSVDQATSLLCDVQPGELERYVAFNGKYGYIRREAIPEEYEGFEELVMDRFSQYLLYKSLIMIAISAHKLRPHDGDGVDALLDPLDVMKWAMRKPLVTLSLDLIEAMNVAHPGENLQIDEPVEGPEAHYSTRLMKIMHKAVKEFWLDYDPAKPPKSRHIIQWLRQNFKLSNNTAKAIDLVIRPDEKKAGGNVKIKEVTPKSQ